MSNVPDGAQLSDDGQYWWDGNQWQPVDQGSSDAPSGGPGGDVPGDIVIEYADPSDEDEIDAVDPNDYPFLYAMVNASSFEDWLSSMGFDPSVFADESSAESNGASGDDSSGGGDGTTGSEDGG